MIPPPLIPIVYHTAADRLLLVRGDGIGTVVLVNGLGPSLFAREELALSSASPRGFDEAPVSVDDLLDIDDQ